MAVSLKKRPLREYTPVHLIDEEESIQQRDGRENSTAEAGNALLHVYTPVHLIDEEESIRKSEKHETSQPCGKNDMPRRKYVASHLADTRKNEDQIVPSCEETDESSETPKSKKKRFIEKIGDIWFDITCLIPDGFGPLICVTILMILSVISMPILADFMDDIAFVLSAVETSAEVISVGTAENKDLQGVIVSFTDIYGNEQKSKVLINKRTDIKIGDVILISYNPNNAEKVKVKSPITFILDP